MEPTPTIPVTIRSFEPRDSEICRQLYFEGLIGGKIAENDTGVDIDDIHQAYMARPELGHFWVAENSAGDVVGMIGVQHLEDDEAEIRRLRVRQDHRRRGIGTALLETAIRHCHDKQALKVTLDTFVEREAATKLFEKFKMKLSRTREIGDKALHYFYLDLYSRTPTDKPRT